MVWYLVQASQALQAVQAVQPMLHGESPPMMTPLQQVRLFKNKHYEILIYQNLVTFASIPTHYSRTPPSCLQWTRPRLLQLSSTALFRSTLLYRLVLIWSPNNLMSHSQIIAVSTSKNATLQVSAWPAEPGDAPVYQVATTGGQVQLQYASPSSQHRFYSLTCAQDSTSNHFHSGAGGPITNFGHQLLLPTQFSFGPGTPGESPTSTSMSSI